MGSEEIVALIIVMGIAVVLPLALGHAGRWLIAAGAVLLSVSVPTGLISAGLAAVWLVVALTVFAPMALRALAHARDLTLAAVVPVAAAGYAVVAAGAFVASRAGWSLFGIGEPIVELTAVHFTYAGVGALVLAGGVMARADGPRLVAARLAVLLTMFAPPVVATGFVTGNAVPQVGGALLMTTAVFIVAALQLLEAVALKWGSTRALLLTSGLAPWLPMGLAISWAASNFWTVPALSIPDMVRTHGTLNAVFVIAGLIARRIAPDTELVRDPRFEGRVAQRTEAA